jgi:3alpha(or 20beta)-hydroxysteroid dehydrogenase
MQSHGPIGIRLRDKVALISGGARGMGASHAHAMAAEGANVVIADVLDEAGEVVAADIGDRASYVHLDVTDRQGWDAAVAATLQQFGKLNVLVNNAAIATFGELADFSFEQWSAILAVNLTGVFNGIQASLPALKVAAPSSIINISSTTGLQGYTKLAAYTATKFGVRGLTKAVALELGPHGVRCNSVHPGTIATPMTHGLDHTVSLTHTALHRIGRPEEVSALIVFLASDESSFCTGAEFVADGGETAGLTGTGGVADSRGVGS